MSTRTIRVYICDRCGKEITEGDCADSEMYQLDATEILVTGWTGGTYELCAPCWGAFINLFIGGLCVPNVDPF